MSTPGIAPADYQRCDRCGTLRPVDRLIVVVVEVPGAIAVSCHCVEMDFCSNTARVGQGKMDVEAKP
jgi:hypothetical protein